MNQPTLSLIIPIYNVEKYLEECIESVLAQNLDDMEIVLVDDGSTDSSGDIADRYAQKHTQITAFHKPNGGLASARNYGLERASGKYIAFLDSDDTWIKGNLKKILDFGISNDADIIIFDYIQENAKGNHDDISFCEKSLIIDKARDNQLLAESILLPVKGLPSTKKLSMSVCAAIFRKELIPHRFVSEREIGSEDAPFKIEALLNSKRTVYIPLPLFEYRYTGGSLSKTFLIEKFSRYVKLEGLLKNIFEKTSLTKASNGWMICAMSFFIHGLYNSTLSRRQRIKAFKCMADTYNWTKCELSDEMILGRKERLMLMIFKLRMWPLAFGISEIFYCFKKR